MEKIVSRPFSKDGLKNFDRIFRKANVDQEVERLADTKVRHRVGGSTPPVSRTIVCVNNDPHFGG